MRLFFRLTNGNLRQHYSKNFWITQNISQLM